jgi:uncharacterized protein YdaL
MTARSILFACAALVLVMTGRPTNAEILQGVPDVIVCDVGKGKIVVYVARRLDDGSTLYEALEREFVAEVTIDTNGVIHWENQPSCDGKSVQQLRDQGSVFDFGG